MIRAKGDPATVYLEGLAEGSRPTMETSLRAIAAISRRASRDEIDIEKFPWHAMTYRETAAVRAVLADRYAPATANKILAALRGVLRAAWRLELMDSESYHRAADLPSIRGAGLPRGRALSAGELSALFEACEDGKVRGIRDAALFAVLYGCGLRRAEAAALDLSSWDDEEEALSVTVAKGRKARVVPVPPGATAALRAWLEARGARAGALFVRMLSTGKPTRKRLRSESIRTILIDRARRAKIKRCAPHDLRRTFVSDLLDRGADVFVVGRLAGHSNAATTTRYDRRGDAAKRRASGLLHVPYSGSA